MSDLLIPAAEYVRMSTEDQRYSIVNQQAAIARYAAANNYRIVASFADPGISGLDLTHRPALKALLATVLKGDAPFRAILVLDISRWGRFQDVDESAHYEFVCRQAGVRIQYCAEPFENNSTPYSNLVKTIKRVMAAEYSRELSTKVFQGQARLAALGYKQGGAPRLGLRRLMIDKDGNPKQLLKRGERKSLTTDRVLLVPGPAREVRFVNHVFQAVLSGVPLAVLSKDLQRRKTFGRNWDQTKLLNLLQNPQYAGIYVYNRLSVRLKTRAVAVPREHWIIARGALTPIVPLELFEGVQAKLANFTCRLTNEELLLRLKRLWEQTGYLSVRLIDKSREVPSVATYRQRFGDLRTAFRMVGYPTSDKGVSQRQALAQMRRVTWEAMKRNLVENGMRLRSASRVPYDIQANGMPIFNLMFAYQLPGVRKVHGPTWEIHPPRRSPIGRCVIAILSSDRRQITEFVLSRGLRKAPVRRVYLTLPLLARFSLARFKSPTQFCDALKHAGFID